MIQVPTIHNEAKAGDIAPKVILPGDPVRAKFIAENYFTETKHFNAVRGALGYTGLYRGQTLSVMASGMGMPSMGIYAQELFEGYGVEEIYRVGTAGSLREEVKIHDVILAVSASTDSNFAAAYHLPGIIAPTADFGLVQRIAATAEYHQVELKAGNILTSDRFYQPCPEDMKVWGAMGTLAVEMETAALYLVAAQTGKKAVSLLTVTDNALTGETMPPKEKERSLRRMIVVAMNA